jgi:hypothetical protein
MEESMAKVTFILGLSGSGKSYLAHRLQSETGAELFENLLSDDSSLPALIENLKAGKDCIVDEVRFCLPTYRVGVVQHLSQITDLETEWICYENDLESANWNVMHRTDKGDPEGHLDLNLRLHPHYEYPSGAQIIPIQRI